MVDPIPEGFRTVTPHLVVKGAAAALDFYKKAFGAEECIRMPAPDGRIMHAEIKIGDSIVMLADEFPEWGMPPRNPQALGGTSVTLHTYVPDVDASFERASEAGCTVAMPPTDMFWGDRYGKVVDPFGHEWAIATHKVDLSPEEMAEAAKAALSQPPGNAPPRE